VLVSLVVTNALWGTNVSVVKWAIGQWNPLAYSLLRFCVGTAVFALWVYLREGSLRVERRDLPLLALCGAIGIFGNQIGFMYAVRYAPATTVSLLMITSPMFAALLAIALGQERVGWRHWVGIAIAGLGLLLVLRGSGATLDLSSLRGDLFGLLMSASWGCYSVLIRPLMTRYSASRISVMVLIVGTPMMLPFAWGQLASQDFGAISVGGWSALVYSLFFSLVFTNIMWFGAIHAGGAARATALLPLQPVIGAGVAAVFLGERIGLLELVGGAIVVVGIILTRRDVHVEDVSLAD
jgi:drug/metabolite transporter (DMT)-like permease